MRILELLGKGDCFNGHNVFYDCISNFSFHMENMHIKFTIAMIVSFLLYFGASYYFIIRRK